MKGELELFGASVSGEEKDKARGDGKMRQRERKKRRRERKEVFGASVASK